MSVIIFLLVLRTAWLSDDAYISFRVVDNFVNGFGLRWNVAERVQAFTNPLWVLLLAIPYSFTNEIYFTSLALSITFSICTCYLIFSAVAVSRAQQLLVFLLIVSSNSFIDYSTSGLENPLIHFLLVVFFRQALRCSQQYRLALLMAALLCLTRLDALLIIFPTCFLLYQRISSRPFLNLLLGFSPLFLWGIFSLIYYGDLVPNTFYAKYPPHTSRTALCQQGLLYLLDAIIYDPFTILTICISILTTIKGRCLISQSFAVGIILHLFYIILVGGDFMSGRFLSSPFIVACCIIAHSRIPIGWLSPLVSTAFLAIMMSENLSMPLTSGNEIGNKTASFIRHTGIADERAFYFSATGLMNINRGSSFPQHPWKDAGLNARLNSKTNVEIFPWTGFFGFHAGPNVHIIDPHALSDPFLSHLPAIQRSDWRIGHLERAVPNEYLLSLRNKKNMLADPGLAKFFDRTFLITRAPLFSIERFEAIFTRSKPLGSILNGNGSHSPLHIELDSLAKHTADGTPWNAGGNTILSIRGVQILTKSLAHAPHVAISLDCNDAYQISFNNGGKSVYAYQVETRLNAACGLREEIINIPPLAASEGYNSIVVKPIYKQDDLYSLGHLKLLDSAP